MAAPFFWRIIKMQKADIAIVEEVARRIAKEEIALALAPPPELTVVEEAALEAVVEPPTPDPVVVDE